MKRLLWLALLSLCAACGAPTDDGNNGAATNGADDGAAVADAATLAGLPTSVDADEPATSSEAENAATAGDPAEAADPGESSDTVDSVEATDPSEATDPVENPDPPENADPVENAVPADADAESDGAAADDSAKPAEPTATAGASGTSDPTEANLPQEELADATAAVEAAIDAAKAATAIDMLGIVADKPAEGPFVETDYGFMVPYTAQIPGTDVKFEMIPIAGGTFTMGSPESEADREDDEGPQVEVTVEPFWMAKHELTWAEYRSYMRLVDIFIDFKGRKMRPVTDENRCDAVTVPSNLYDPSMTFKNGEDPQQPAVTMTPFGARQYTKWLSRLTGQIYRLPTEAEWEYACRAGTTTPYHFGDDPGELGDYAWYAENSDETTHPVGQKKPNPWGLYDMYGNVSEIVLDEYREDAYGKLGAKTTAAAAIAWPTDYDNRVHRGGNYDEFEDGCRSASRSFTEGEDWKIDDPNEPKSPWWYSDPPTLGVGMRLVRPLKVPSDDELVKVWDAAVEDVQDSADQRISEGRGAWGLVDDKLPDAVAELEKIKAGG